MSSLASTYFSLQPALLFLPFLIVVIAMVAVRRMRTRKWIAHALAFSAMFLAVPVYVEIGAILDPYSVELPGPLDGLFYLVCMCIAVLTMIGYTICLAVLAVLSRRRKQSQACSPA